MPNDTAITLLRVLAAHLRVLLDQGRLEPSTAVVIAPDVNRAEEFLRRDLSA